MEKKLKEIIDRARLESTTKSDIFVKELLDLFSDSSDANDNKAHYNALLYCCNKILDSVDAGKIPKKEIRGLRILLNR